jgi:hypothetical protein
VTPASHESLYLLDPNQWRATVFLVIHNNFADPTALCWGQIIQVSVGWVAAVGLTYRDKLRKVGTPKGRVLGKNQAPRGDGKCNRKQTADGLATSITGKAETVR